MNHFLIAATATAQKCTSQSFLPDLFEGLRDPSTCALQINSYNRVALLFANVLNAALALAGLTAVGFIIAAGIMYMISNGDSSGIKRAKDTFVNALVGLGIVLGAIGVVNFVAKAFS